MTKKKLRLPARLTGYGKGTVAAFALVAFTVGVATGLGLGAVAIAQQFPPYGKGKNS
jgi:hypothetical protein